MHDTSFQIFEDHLGETEYPLSTNNGEQAELIGRQIPARVKEAFAKSDRFSEY